MVNAATKATFSNDKSVILICNRFMLDDDPNPMESLLNPHQACAHHLQIDETVMFHHCVDGEFGGQEFVIEIHCFPLCFDS